MKQHSKIVCEDGKFIFEYDDKRIEFSAPSIQPFGDENRKITGKDIMYYYYTLTLYDKEEADEEDAPATWVEVASVEAYDVPAVRSYQKALKKILKYDVKKNGFNVKLGRKVDDETQEWSCTWNIDGWIFKEDEYIITKTKRRVWKLTEYQEPEWYDLYVGCGGYTKHNTVGVRMVMLNREDLKSLKYVVDRFIKFSIDECNEKAGV